MGIDSVFTSALFKGVSVVSSATKTKLNLATEAVGITKHLDAPYFEYNPSYIDRMNKAQQAEQRAVNVLKKAGCEVHHSKIRGDKGFDSLAIKYNPDGTIRDIYIVESKYSSSGYGKLTNNADGIKQMSDRWIENNITIMKRSKTNLEIQKLGDILDANKHLVSRITNVMNKDGINKWNSIKLPPSTQFKK